MRQKNEKLKQFIIKHDELFFILIFFIIIFGITIYIKTDPTDEVWNFQNIYKMYNGYKIYVDANVITTPLFHFIGVIVFKLFGANFFVFKLYGILINILLFFGVYKILKSLNISKLLSIFFSIILFMAQMNVYHNTSNYNNLCLLFATYGLLVAINREKFSCNKFALIESLITFLIILTKQNIGIIYLFSIIIYNLLFEKKYRFKNILKIIIINLLLMVIFIAILNKYEILEGFISYTILGIREFASKNVAVEGPIIKLVVIFLIDLIFIILINRNKILYNKNIKNINVIASFAFPFLMVTYPIFNVSHIDLALFFMYILLIYIIYNIYFDLLCNKNLIYKLTIFLIILLTIISNVRIVIYFCEINNVYDYDNLYFGSLLSNESKYKIKNVTEYIENSKENVIVFSTEAALYMMPLNRSNGSMDEPLLGNFGKDGENGIIEEISKMENTKIIINKEKKVYQESDKIIQYIKDNLNYVGEIEDLLIYQTKK